MARKFRSPAIDSHAPWDDDILERRPFGEMVAQLIDGIVEPFVISLKGGWGSGKSVFLRRLEAHFESRAPRIPVISIDAWKYDYYEDPIFALVSAIDDRLSKENANKSLSASMFENASKMLAPLGKIAGGLAETVTAGGASTVYEGMGELGGALLAANKEKKNAYTELLKKLEEARDLLLGQDSTGNLKGRKVVVLIDELDRCRPSYAVKLLERVKHFFDIRGYVFVIATDDRNLHDAVKSLYGASVDGEEYLRRFFDLEMYLPSPSTKQFNKLLRRDFGIVDEANLSDEEWSQTWAEAYTNFGADDASRRRGAFLEASRDFEVIAQAYGLKLRDQAQAFARLNYCVSAQGGRVGFLPIAAAFIVCLRYYDYEAYEKWRKSLKYGGLPVNTKYYSGVQAVDHDVGEYLEVYLNALSVEGRSVERHLTSDRRDTNRYLLRRLGSAPDKWQNFLYRSYSDVFSLMSVISEETKY
ncbi:P-loop NTPase fold protein [Xanthomonas sp. WHRI 10064A]|uniref:KAP family P-loop NTPase fold protein n=1 Tax=unclassified Xanthomonas TaxID=2643310 RepID=UPI002B2312B8|nr:MULTISPECIES: P-loop NTPase fold protein [unclassified Xanthomonas]MEA9588186.1 P-loop NTPase fold protein [Xanthomonas sp. WHRI 10064B]MEA9615908.1 P-loop NTPase fold protein [Xanthomonas sp. WHRI 10064A]